MSSNRPSLPLNSSSTGYYLQEGYTPPGHQGPPPPPKWAYGQRETYIPPALGGVQSIQSHHASQSATSPSSESGADAASFQKAFYPSGGSAVPGSVQTAINQVVNQLTPWEKADARQKIQDKLAATPADQHQLLLQNLSSELSGQAGAAKLGIVREWAETATAETAASGRDRRTDSVRDLQDKLAKWKEDPAFARPLQDILGMMDSSHTRRSISDRARVRRITITTRKNRCYWDSVLYEHIFSDSRGPVAALEDIRKLIEPLLLSQRYNAIKNWVPR